MLIKSINLLNWFHIPMNRTVIWYFIDKFEDDIPIY